MENGRRPMSAAEARAAAVRANEPSYRVPRATEAGRHQCNIGSHNDAQQRGHVDGLGAAAKPMGGGARDEHAAAPAASGANQRPARADAAGSEDVDAIISRRGRWADQTPPCDRADGEDDETSMADCDEDWEEEDDDGYDCGWVYQPTADDLRGRWLQECRAVKALERAEKGDHGPSAALAAARNARDRAEEEWRGALAPKPVSLRMGYAQKKLDRAQRALERASLELQQFEEEAEQRRSELRGAVDEAEKRRQGRQDELDALHREAGELAAANEAREQRGAVSKESEKLLDMVAKEIQALVETLEEGSEARGRANLLLARVATAPEPEDGRHFSIHTDGEDASCDDAFQLVARRSRGTKGGKGPQAPHRETTWCANAQGRWNRQKHDAVHEERRQMSEDRPSKVADGNCGGGGAGAASSNEPKPQGATAAGAPKPAVDGAIVARSRKGARERDDEHEQNPNPNKVHRGEDDSNLVSVEGNGDDAARALRLQREQEIAIQAAQAAQATFGDSTSMQIAGQLYAQKVEQVRSRAKAVSIEPVANAKQLIELSPEELNMWIRDVLAPAEAGAKADDEY